MAERSLGIDLSAQASKTWACTLSWSPAGTLDDVRFHARQTDAELLALMRDADTTGIDAPFGWPRAFLDAMESYRRDDRWPEGQDVAGDTEWSRPLRLRTTDRVVRDRAGVPPLSVSADSLAVCAFRAAGLLTRWCAETGRPIDRTGQTTGVYEVYPAGALAAWGLPHGGYKDGRKNLPAREAIVEGLWESLTRPLPAPAWDDARREMAATDHALDAFVCALVARLAALGATDMPDAHQMDVAGQEGWIHLPAPASAARLRSVP